MHTEERTRQGQENQQDVQGSAGPRAPWRSSPCTKANEPREAAFSTPKSVHVVTPG